MPLTNPQLFGRSGSHFTRMVRIIAVEAGVELSFRQIPDVQSVDLTEYGGHPGLKFPTLVSGGEQIFGSVAICRRLVDESARRLVVTWPEWMPASLQNAWELVSHAMHAQVQLVFGVIVTGLPGDHIYFGKAREGLEGILHWLDQRLPHLLPQLPSADFSLLEVALFCLLEHIEFRPTVSIADCSNLAAFKRVFSARPSAVATQYTAPAPSSAPHSTVRREK